ncbi:Golgin subfamily A member 7/ERF4 [Penicillium pulvis]|uniref:Golgin subfamily A member 7/ERF4 n=1 Tax=Penicillium pulvis TaxID=1562058 RepID=UPI0025475952|nr:Golgin subfamily A member 7/ERF4 [Penicillium pulvis]KAJ5785962.1 Golgin subfamily A member 7/ERF4 [Penicillium pulvis]
MRWYLLGLLLLCLHWRQTFAAPAEYKYQDAKNIALLAVRDETDATTTASDNTSSQMTATTATTTTNTASTTTSATSTTHSTSHSTSSQTSQSTLTTSVPSLVSSSGSSDDQSSTNSTEQTYTGGLPIRPSITPALGVGGFILLAAGGVLSFVGVRKPRISIFLSTGLLAALGVTVLIEYVMNPPVSNGVQGGYLVAIFFTGAIFGGLSLVFKEITEGLCCLLGGFCIGMWFLTVKAGGLVTGDGAKVGFILAFTGGFYCLSFSHYTRSYGSMLCTAFGGATAMVLGIDCYSRAGLKEFWLYLWGLNANLFPLNTYTYPITRNIRVELAIIIIVTVFGVIFQLRLWKVIKERRAREESARQEAERAKEEAEAENGRRIEEKNLRERAEWEQMYGNGSEGAKEPSLSETAVADDSRRSSDAYGSSVREKGNSIEMTEMTSPDPLSARVSDSGNHLEAVEEVEAETIAEGTDGHATEGREPSQHQGEQADQEIARPTTPDPKDLHTETNIHPDNSSEHGAVLGSEIGTPRSKRFSSRSLMNRMSWRSGHTMKPLPHNQSEEALIDADASSSVAGMVDDLQSVTSDRSSLAELEVAADTTPASNSGEKLPPNDVASETTPKIDERKALDTSTASVVTAVRDVDASEVSTQQKSMQGDENPRKIHESGVLEQMATAEATSGAEINTGKSDAIEDQQPSPVVSEPAVANPEQQAESVKNEVTKPEGTIAESKSATETREKAEKDAAVLPDEVVPAQPLVVQPKPVKKPKLDVSTVQNIPEQTSRVVNSFRTREWAKHLANADAPDCEPIQFESEEQDDPTASEEMAAPVDIHGLLQTPLNAQPPPAIMSPASTSPEQTYYQSQTSLVSPDISQLKTRKSMQNLTSAKSPPLSRNVSSGSSNPQEHHEMATMRNSASTPYLTVTTANPPEEVAESPRWSGPAPLLAVRENMMKNRMSSTSLRYDPWGPRSQSRQSLADPTRVVSPTMPILEAEEAVAISPHIEDDIPLSKRRALLQRQTMRSPSGASSPSLEQIRSPISPASGDPNRSEAMMSAWRQSVREDLSQRRDPLAMKSPPLGATSPASPDRPRNTWGSVQQMRDASATHIGNSIAEGMQKET